MTTSVNQQALDAKARRAAKRAGLYARKSRRGAGSVDNHGDFALIDPATNFMVAGFRFDMTAQEVIEYCE